MNSSFCHAFFTITFVLIATLLGTGCASLPRYYRAGDLSQPGGKANKFVSPMQIRVVNNTRFVVTVFENGQANQGDLLHLAPGQVETIHVRSHYLEEQGVPVVLHARAEAAGSGAKAPTRVPTRQFWFNNQRWSVYGGPGFGVPPTQVYTWDITDWEFGQ
jgi:hypothetical protein